MHVFPVPSGSKKVILICSRMQSSWPSPAVEGAASSQLHFSAIFPCTVQAPHSTPLNVMCLYIQARDDMQREACLRCPDSGGLRRRVGVSSAGDWRSAACDRGQSATTTRRLRK